jgi:hypothetical protein
MSNSMKKKVKNLLISILNIGKPKVFCLSFQKSGTSSVGKFFRLYGNKVASWNTSKRNGWAYLWLKGDYEKIFRSSDFKYHNVFEDGPWWFKDFYKVLYHRFPKSKFILLERDADKWYDSMMNHYSQPPVINYYLFANIYGLPLDGISKSTLEKIAYSMDKDSLLELKEDNREFYIGEYRRRIDEIKLFFQKFESNRFFYGRLEDKNVWYNLGKFFRIDVPENFLVHSNQRRSHRMDKKQ